MVLICDSVIVFSSAIVHGFLDTIFFKFSQRTSQAFKFGDVGSSLSNIGYRFDETFLENVMKNAKHCIIYVRSGAFLLKPG
jgi:hypothetical protein